MVEFALAITVFLALLFGGIDVARAMFFTHNLNRSAEVVDRELVDNYSSSSPSSFISLTVPVSGTQILADAQHQGDGTVRTQALVQASTCTVQTAGTGYTCTQWSNATSNGNPGVYVCSVLDSGSRVNMVQVTIKDRFSPVTGMFIGGKTIMLSSSESALTADGEASGSDPAGTGYGGICPSVP